MWAVAAGLTLVGGMCGLGAAVVLPKSPLGRPLVRLPRTDAVALTFDDGPDPRWTPLVLDHLARSGQRATFFVIGAQLDREPDLVRRMAEEGHAVEVHGRLHRPATLQAPAVLRDELKGMVDRIGDLTGRAPRWYRPPWGARPLRPVWRTCGLSLVTWSWMCHDWDGGQRGRWQPVQGGDVVLLHDGPCRDVTSRERTLAVLDSIQGWRTVLLSDHALDAAPPAP